MLYRNMDRMQIKVDVLKKNSRYYHDDQHIIYGFVWMITCRDHENSIKVREKSPGPYLAPDKQSINVNIDTVTTTFRLHFRVSRAYQKRESWV